MPSNLRLFSERLVPRHGWYSKNRLPSVVAVEAMVHAKLHSHYDRRKYTSTDFNDLLWLIQHCADEVYAGRVLYYDKHYQYFAATAYAYSETWGNRAADVLGFPRAEWTEEFVAQVNQARALLRLENAVMF
jgi:predicted nucleotidyltransferase